MTSKRSGWSAAALVASGALLALVPSMATAETRSYYDATPLFPTGGAEGPANEYPSTIPVSGVPGTVTEVEVTLFGFSSGNADDADAVLVGPNGAKVMLLSDVCGDDSASSATWTFDDDAPTFISNNGPCGVIDEQRFMPSNYLGNDSPDDDLSVAPGGPAPPYVNSLSALAGASPNGVWRLFMLDDQDGILGFAIDGWALRLKVEPPPPPGTGTASNQFTIGELDGRKLSVDVASAGTVTIDDAGAKNRLKESEVTGGPGTVEVKVKPTKLAKRVLKYRGKVKAKAEVTFAPNGGAPATQPTKLKLRG